MSRGSRIRGWCLLASSLALGACRTEVSPPAFFFARELEKASARFDSLQFRVLARNDAGAFRSPVRVFLEEVRSRRAADAIVLGEETRDRAPGYLDP
jgi:hypothetical protein